MLQPPCTELPVELRVLSNGTSVERRMSVIHRPAESRLCSCLAVWPSLCSVVSMYVPRRLEQLPLAFHRPVGLTIIALLAGRRYLHHWIKHECHVHKLQHLPEHCSIREHCASVEQPPRLLSIAPLIE